MATHTDKDILAGNGVDFVITPWKPELVTPVGYDLTIGVAATITGNSLALSMSGKEEAPVTLRYQVMVSCSFFRRSLFGYLSASRARFTQEAPFLRRAC